MHKSSQRRRKSTWWLARFGCSLTSSRRSALLSLLGSLDTDWLLRVRHCKATFEAATGRSPYNPERLRCCYFLKKQMNNQLSFAKWHFSLPTFAQGRSFFVCLHFVQSGLKCREQLDCICCCYNQVNSGRFCLWKPSLGGAAPTEDSAVQHPDSGRWLWTQAVFREPVPLGTGTAPLC